jgi:hypothetical protein
MSVFCLARSIECALKLRPGHASVEEGPYFPDQVLEGRTGFLTCDELPLM